MDAAYDLIWEYSYGAVTIDAICERAAVKKGSFYYFFASKSELAVVAIEAWWKERHALLEEIFHRDEPPLSRLRAYLDYVSERQLGSYRQTGQVLGCPIYCLGAEICAQDGKLLSEIRTILKHIAVYFEAPIREAQERGEIAPGCAARKAQTFLHYYAGVLMQARIENNPELLRRLADDVLEVLGARRGPVLFSEPFATPAAPAAQLAPFA